MCIRDSFLVLVRLAGGMVAGFFESTLGLASKRLGHAVADKVRSFHAGLDTMRSFSAVSYTHLDVYKRQHCDYMQASVARQLCGLLRPFGAVVFTFDRPGRDVYKRQRQ